MIFYASALSSYSAKVRLALCVKQVDFEERAPPGGGARAGAVAWRHPRLVEPGILIWPCMQEIRW